MGCSKSSLKREVYSNTILPQEARTSSNRQPNFIPKTTEKRIKKPPKLEKERNHKKICAEINENEMKETISSVQFCHSVVSNSL